MRHMHREGNLHCRPHAARNEILRRAKQEIANAGQGLDLLEEQSHARGTAAPDLVGAGAIPIDLFGQSDDVD